MISHFRKVLQSLGSSRPDVVKKLAESDHFLSLVDDKCRLPSPEPLRILELGAGCGTAGLALATMLPKSKVLLTDLPEALQVMEANIKCLGLASNSDTEVQGLELDWHDAVNVPNHATDVLRSSILKGKLDLIVVSDCTYNEDTLKILFGTLRMLTDQGNYGGSRSPAVMVARKPRHDSEEAFFHLMQRSFDVKQRHRVVLPDRAKATGPSAEEAVQIHVYERSGRRHG